MLNQIYFIITQRCNYQCPFCIRDNLDGKDVEINVEHAKDALSMLSESYANSALIITGGEPLLHPYWDDIIHFATLRFPIVSISTNGSFSSNTALALIKYLQNNLNLQMSLDGTKDVHDSIRGNGAYNKVIENLSLLKNYSSHISISTTVGVRNINDVPNLAKELHNYSFSHWKIALEQAQNPLCDSMIDIKTWNLLVDRLVTSCNYKILTKKFFDFNLMDRFLPIYNPTIHKLMTNCGYCKQKIYVTPSLDVLPCSCTNKVLGNLHNESIEDIMLKAQESCIISPDRNSVCFSCKYKEICNGGCPGYSIKVFGKIGMGDIRCPFVKTSLTKNLSTKSEIQPT